MLPPPEWERDWGPGLFGLGQGLIDGANESGGPAFWRSAGSGTGVWTLDCTKPLANPENAPHEGGAVSKNEGRLPIRGYKPALLSASMEEGAAHTDRRSLHCRT